MNGDCVLKQRVKRNLNYRELKRTFKRGQTKISFRDGIERSMNSDSAKAIQMASLLERQTYYASPIKVLEVH